MVTCMHLPHNLVTFELALCDVIVWCLVWSPSRVDSRRFTDLTSLTTSTTPSVSGGVLLMDCCCCCVVVCLAITVCVVIGCCCVFLFVLCVVVCTVHVCCVFLQIGVCLSFMCINELIHFCMCAIM